MHINEDNPLMQIASIHKSIQLSENWLLKKLIELAIMLKSLKSLKLNSKIDPRSIL